eukprot:TRINITY_DN1995_c0_g1_i4.p1 TRINITY_DN1995_c0_g1~~TRINITY_DN1995_c0_g1_i4.p1  ORF type:complete len:299 (-),score=33.32 TRINITY_DN1995_c0_g1_i4:1091-1987(-)
MCYNTKQTVQALTIVNYMICHARPILCQKNNEQCLICLTYGMEAPATVLPCEHQFCLQCVKQWTEIQRFPTCPVCQYQIQALQKEDGTCEVIEENVNIITAESDLNLDSLDHAYFVKEIKRLLDFAQDVSSKLMQALSYSSRNKYNQVSQEDLGGALATNNTIISFLQQYRSQMQLLVNFDAMQVLSHLYKLQEQCQRILSATFGSKTESRKEILEDARMVVHGMLIEADLEGVEALETAPKVYGASDVDDIVFDTDEFEADDGAYDYDDNEEMMQEYTGKRSGPNKQPKKKSMWPDD